LAYLFECSNLHIYALSTDKTGANIPRLESSQAWLLRRDMTEAQLALHFPDDLARLDHSGYCLVCTMDVRRAA
jgi:hypothetical protein